MKTPPGPRGRAVFGFFGNGSLGGTVGFLERTARAFGPVSYFRLIHQRIYLIDDASLVEQVLVTRQHEFVRDTGATLLRELVGDGVLTQDEPLHRARRRILQPAFHRAQIAEYAALMVRETDRLTSEWKSQSFIDIQRAMRRLTLTIVGAALFGADLSCRAEAIAAILQTVVKRSRWLAPAVALLEPGLLIYRRWSPGGRSVCFNKPREQLKGVIQPIIQERRQHETNDLMSLLLAAQDEDGARLTDREIQNEVITFVLAGHETTAMALTWAWYLLARNPAVERLMHAELDQVLAGEPPAVEHVPNLRYTTHVFKEAMRLYPPALAFGRRPKHDVELGGYTVPKMSTILLSPYVTHRNPLYFPSPSEFRPERWEAAAHPKLAYFPFGAGAKMCIGEPFASLEGVLVLAAIGRHWRLAGMQQLGEIDLDRALLLRPNSSLPLCFVRRTP